MKTICFVCTGNTCRSPIAEKLLNKKLKKMKITEFSVSSCGIFADGSDMTNEAKEVLNKNGIKVKTRKSKKLTNSLLKKTNTLFLTMTKEHVKMVNSKNVYSIGEFVGGSDVLDPYGLGILEYEKTFKQLDEYTTIIAQKIKNVIGD